MCEFAADFQDTPPPLHLFTAFRHAQSTIPAQKRSLGLISASIRTTICITCLAARLCVMPLASTETPLEAAQVRFRFYSASESLIDML